MSQKLLKDRIYDYVSENVQRGTFRPGDKIPEESVAAVLGVSRTPVREALTALACEGVVEKVPRRGFFVGRADPQKSREILEVIGWLDRRVAVLAAPHLTPEDLKRMRECVAKMELAIRFENLADYTQNQALFHEIYAARCPNRALVETLNAIVFSHIPHTYIEDASPFGTFAHSNAEHTELCAAFERGDTARLADLIEQHWTEQ